MKSLLKTALTAAFVCCGLSAPASASSVIDGSCVSVANANGCLFSGNINGNNNAGNVNSFLNAQNAYNSYNNTHPLANPDIALNYLGDTKDGFPGTFTGSGGLSGTWTLNAGFIANFLAVKAGDNFKIYQLTPSNFGNWSTSGLVNDKGKQQGLSHLVFFGTQGAVPEPATWMMMLFGFGLVGSAMRRRKTNVSFA